MVFMTIQAAFGVALRELRSELGMSQEALSLKAGLNRGYYNGVELGKRNISLANVEKLANALDLPPSAIFRRAERLRR